MLQETKDLILRSLSSYAGDDYERAKMAFSRMTAQQMKEQHGQSGKTRAQILEEYETHRRKVNNAMAEVRAL